MKEVGDTLIVDVNEVVEADLTPLRREDLLRKILVKSGARVKGSIVGGSVELELGCTIEGGVLASEVVIRMERSEHDSESVIMVGRDVVSLSSIVSVPSPLAVPGDSLMFVRGNLIASDMIRVANALIVGDVISSSVELHNIISFGVLGLTRFKKDSEVPQSRVSNSVVFSVLSDESMEVLGDLGLVAPVIYFSPNTSVVGDGNIVLVDPEHMLRSLPELLRTARDSSFKIGDYIKNYLKVQSLYRLPVQNLPGLISFLELEPLFLTKKRRKRLKDAFAVLVSEEL
ncbi:MAG: hypothetical protein QXZ48_07850 [Zestosphaera sp.]